MRTVFALIIGAAALTTSPYIRLAMAHEAGEAPQVLTVPGNGDAEIRIPLGGPLYDAQAEGVARAILASDREIEVLRRRPATEPNLALLALARELRAESYRNLDLAVRVSKTSSGAAQDLVNLARDTAGAATVTATAAAPPGLELLTEITGPVGAVLHYIAKGEYDSAEPAGRRWTSYASGDRLRIGRYVFNVQPGQQPAAAAETAFEEIVLVIAEPTKRSLQPMRGPVK